MKKWKNFSRKQKPSPYVRAAIFKIIINELKPRFPFLEFTTNINVSKVIIKGNQHELVHSILSIKKTLNRVKDSCIRISRDYPVRYLRNHLNAYDLETVLSRKTVV